LLQNLIDIMEPLQNEAFEYVYNYVEKNFPSVDYDPDMGVMLYLDLTKAMTFEDRYYNNKIHIGIKYEDYLKDKEFQETIDAFGLDKEKFWYLIVFILDYSTCFSFNKVPDVLSPKEQLKKLSNEIDNNIDYLNETPLKITFDKPIKIVLDIKGKHKFVIDDPTTLYVISRLFMNQANNINEDSSLNFGIIPMLNEDGNSNIETVSNSVHIAYFAMMFITFFDNNPEFKGIKKKGSTVSLNKQLFISKLVYFTKLSRSESFLTSTETLKGFLKQYKDLDMNRPNMIYF